MFTQKFPLLAPVPHPTMFPETVLKSDRMSFMQLVTNRCVTIHPTPNTGRTGIIQLNIREHHRRQRSLLKYRVLP